MARNLMQLLIPLDIVPIVDSYSHQNASVIHG